MSKQLKSPIKDKPLRYPGQSLDQQRANLIDDRLMGPILIVLFMFVLAGLEWWRFYHPSRPDPFVATLLAILTVLYAAWQFWRTWPALKKLKLASEGEKVVGQFLERLRERGYHVYHDLIGDDFNIDHVLIGPAGVYTIETKTWSKPSRGESRIKFDGELLTVNGSVPERNPVIQARAQSNWLRNVLLESTGRNFDVFPVVVCPGWYIEHAAGSLRKMWVLEPKALPKFLENELDRLSSEEVKLASFHLSRFIRSAEQGRNK